MWLSNRILITSQDTRKVSTKKCIYFYITQFCIIFSIFFSRIEAFLEVSLVNLKNQHWNSTSFESLETKCRTIFGSFFRWFSIKQKNPQIKKIHFQVAKIEIWLKIFQITWFWENKLNFFYEFRLLRWINGKRGFSVGK